MGKCTLPLILLLLGMIERSEMKCKPTSSDILGPFYYPNPPRQKRFCRYKREITDLKDIPLHVFGRVFARDCKTPLPRVKVEMWQANHEGEYANHTKCRGFVRTNKYGFYELTTIYPGKYTASGEGDDFRPAHLHFKINGKKGHKSLVTQMYFSDDPDLGEFDSCIGCSSHRKDLIIKPQRICNFGKKRKTSCKDVAEFNITLAKGKGLHVKLAETEEDNILFISPESGTGTKDIPEELEPFVRSCLEVCWYSAIQDPPLSFVFDTGVSWELDTNYFEMFTKTGIYVDFIVWPAMLLHSNGAVLQKGVVQALDEKSHRPQQ